VHDKFQSRIDRPYENTKSEIFPKKWHAKISHPLWREEDIDDDRLLASIMMPNFHHTAPNAEEEDTVLLSWRQTLRLLTRSDPLIQYTIWLHELEAAMNDRPTPHKMLSMDQPEQDILKDLRRILLAADTTIPSTGVESAKQRFLTLCNTIGTVPLIAMSSAASCVEGGRPGTILARSRRPLRQGAYTPPTSAL